MRRGLEDAVRREPRNDDPGRRSHLAVGRDIEVDGLGRRGPRCLLYLARLLGLGRVGAATASGRSLHLPGVTLGGNVDPGSPQFQAAMQACRKYLPGGGPPALTPAQRAEAAKAMAAFAACMRKNGVSSFPDPNGQGTFPPGSLARLDPSTPLVETAFKACESLESKVGPRIELG